MKTSELKEHFYEPVRHRLARIGQQQTVRAELPIYGSFWHRNDKTMRLTSPLGTSNVSNVNELCHLLYALQFYSRYLAAEAPLS